MKHEVRIIDVAELYREALAVYDYEMDVRDEISPKLFSYEATPDEARTWYHTFDPLSEGFSMSLALAVKDAKVHEHDHLNQTLTDLSWEIILDSRVGDIMLGSVALGGSGNNGEYFHDEGSEGLVSYTRNLGIMTRELFEISGLTYEEVENLSLAAEAYAKSGVQLRKSYDAGAVNLGSVITRDEVVGLSDASIGLSIAIRDTLINEAITPENGETDIDRLIELDSIRMVGLRGLIHFFDKPNSRLKAGETEIEPFEALMHLLKILVNPNENTTMSQRLKMKHLKGPLHEIMWAIDTEMLRRMRPDTYGQIHVSPAHAAGDRPQIGKPKHYRSYDYILDRGNVRDFVQLKSSPQANKGHDKKYHPGIWVLEEPNFMEVNPRRLASKLQKYIDIADRGYQREDRAEVEKYIMPTAKWMMNSMLKHRKSRSSLLLERFRDQYLSEDTLFSHELVSAVPKLNRQERRALAKKKK
jgi:hypothetical protein